MRDVLERPNLIGEGKRRLSFTETALLRTVRASFSPGFFSRLLPWFQRTVGQAWIHAGTRNLCSVHGLERIEELSLSSGQEGPSVIVVANHRTFFDLYVITARLVRGGLKKRIIFPVRSTFFYDNWAGLIVNFFMSFLAMYPPLFRDKKKAPLNLLALDELAWLLRRGGVFAGLHPEGTRKRDDDPYTFLRPQPGIGRLVHKARVPVVPVFINGLGNNMFRQLVDNFTGQGKPILVVFGHPIDFTDRLQQKGSPRLYKAIAEDCMAAIARVGEEERALREQLQRSPNPHGATSKDRPADPRAPRTDSPQ